MHNILYKRPIPTAKLIYGTGLFLIGIIGASETTFSLLLCLVSTCFFHSNGIEIDLNKKKYRTIISWFGLRFGQWNNFPQIEYISVFKTTQTTRILVSTASANVTYTIIKVNLFYNTNRKIEAYVTDNSDSAFKIAKKIGTVLNIAILDATSRETKWL